MAWLVGSIYLLKGPLHHWGQSVLLNLQSTDHHLSLHYRRSAIRLIHIALPKPWTEKNSNRNISMRLLNLKLHSLQSHQFQCEHFWQICYRKLKKRSVARLWRIYTRFEIKLYLGDLKKGFLTSPKHADTSPTHMLHTSRFRSAALAWYISTLTHP